MSNDLVKVKLRDDFGREKFVGLCGFFITKGEAKMIAVEDYQAQTKALDLVNPIGEQKDPISESKPEEPMTTGKASEPTTDANRPKWDFNLEKEIGDVVHETTDLITKVRKRGQKKGKK